MVAGVRMHTRYFQAGGLAEDIPPGFYPEARKFCEWMPKAIDDYEGVPEPEHDLARAHARARRSLGGGRGSPSAPRRPLLRASGVDGTCGRPSLYLTYDEVDFDVPVETDGDVYARYRVHIEEMRQSVRIVAQCLDRLEDMDGLPWIADDRKVVLPPRNELHTSMESLIHHFKIVTEGYRVPEGEIYVAVESPRGEFGVYVISDGGPKPWRVKFRAPSFVATPMAATAAPRATADMIAIIGSLDTVMGEVDR